MGSIFELVGQYKELYAMLTDAEEGEDEIIENTLEAVIGEIEVKGDGYVAICNKLDMEIDACEKQVKFWQNELTIRKNALKRIKDRLVMFLTMIGKKEVQTGNHTIKMCGNGGKVPLKYFDENKSDIPQDKVDLSKIPNKYKRVVITEALDTEKIRAALDSGVKLDWCEYGERGSHLKIK